MSNIYELAVNSTNKSETSSSHILHAYTRKRSYETFSQVLLSTIRDRNFAIVHNARQKAQSQAQAAIKRFIDLFGSPGEESKFKLEI